MSSVKSYAIEGGVSDSISQSSSEGVQSDLTVRLFATMRYPPKGRVNSYSKVQYLIDIFELLEGKNELNTLLDSQFGGLFKLQVTRCSFSGVIVHNLLCRQVESENKDEMWFTFGGQPIRFSIVEFQKLTGLNCAHFPNSDDTKLAMSRKKPGPYWSSLIGERDSVSVEYIADTLKNQSNMDPLKKLMLCLVLIVDGILTCGTQPVMVSPATVEMVKDLDVFFRYPWGRVSFMLTLRMVKVGEKVESKSVLVKKLKQISVAVHGFPLAIQLLAFETIPRILRYLPWKDEKFNFIDKEYASLPPLKSYHTNNILTVENHRKLKVVHLYGGADPSAANLRSRGYSDPKVKQLESMILSDRPDVVFSEDMWLGGDSSLEVLVEETTSGKNINSPKEHASKDTSGNKGKEKDTPGNKGKELGQECKGCAELRKVVADLKEKEATRAAQFEEVLENERARIREELLSVIEGRINPPVPTPPGKHKRKENPRKRDKPAIKADCLGSKRRRRSKALDVPPLASCEKEFPMGSPSEPVVDKATSAEAHEPQYTHCIDKDNSTIILHSPPKFPDLDSATLQSVEKAPFHEQDSRPNHSSEAVEKLADDSHIPSPTQPEIPPENLSSFVPSLVQNKSKNPTPNETIICGSSSSDNSPSDEDPEPLLYGPGDANLGADLSADSSEANGVSRRGMKEARKSQRIRLLSLKKMEALSADRLINANKPKKSKTNCMVEPYKPFPGVDKSLSALFESKLNQYKKKNFALDGNVVDKNFFRQMIRPKQHVGNQHMDIMLLSYFQKYSSMLKEKRIFLADSLFFTYLSSKTRQFTQIVNKHTFAWDPFLRNYVAGIAPGRDIIQPWFLDALKILAPMNWGDKHWVALEIDLLAWHISIYDPLIINTADRRVGSLMAPAVELLPHLITDACHSKAKHLARDTQFSYSRVKGIAQNSRSGDCGPISVKFIEMVTQGMSVEQMSDITDAMVDQICLRYAVDIFDQFVGKIL